MTHLLWLVVSFFCATVWSIARGNVDYNERSLAAVSDLAEPLRCFQVTNPVLTEDSLVTDDDTLKTLPWNQADRRACKLTLMEHSFANSYGRPFVADYTPPNCVFNRVVLNFTAVSEGTQFDRLALMYLSDSEVWRISTAEPKRHPGIVWTYWKDMTTYLSLWKKPQKLIFDLGNIVDNKYTGPINTTLTATFFNMKVPGPQAAPASAIFPISALKGSAGQASAYIFPQQNISNSIKIPQNTVRAVVSIAANGQANEEFWWANMGPFNNTNATTPDLTAYREIRLIIDGKIAGLASPFPVIFTGGISPPLHRPIVGIQAFDLLENEIDITPWLGVLCDGVAHTFSIDVIGADGRLPDSNWVVTGKVFVWTDARAKRTYGDPPIVVYTEPSFQGYIKNSSDGVVHYQQNQMSSLKVSGAIEIRGDLVRTSWNQQFSMSNAAECRNSCNYASINGVYKGDSWSVRDSHVDYYNGFKYPIDLTLNSTQGPNATLIQDESDLTQGFHWTVTGASVFASGIEAFVNQINHRVAGSTVSTTRVGKAIILRNSSTILSVLESDVSQKYEFGARKLRDSMGQDASYDPLLYTRSVRERNEHIIEDDVFVYGSDYRAGDVYKGSTLTAGYAWQFA